ncbi:MAG TPA: molybdenum cofactor biosynthesis protein MoaE [Gemmatimonadaceae bacterium]
MIRSAIVDQPIDPSALMGEVRSDDAGAVSVFIGTIRDTSDGRSVNKLEYEAYQSMAEAELSGIVREAAEKFGVEALVAIHRVGELDVGEISVVIASAHAHRGAAIECTRFVIEEIKKRVPIWKREHYADGTREWVDPGARAEASAP